MSISAAEFIKWCEVFGVDFNGGTSGDVNRIIGTANQVIASSPTGDVTLSLPQSIATTSAVAFAGIASGAASGLAGNYFQSFSQTANLGSMTIRSNTNSGNYGNILTNTATTAARTWNLPNADGTIALTSTASGIVNSGTANQLAYYASTGTTVSGLSSANNGFLVTSASGVPSIGNAVLGVLDLGNGASSFQYLRVNGSNAGTSPITTGNYSSTVILANNSNTDGNFSHIFAQNAAGSAIGTIAFIANTQATNAGSMAFYTRPGGGNQTLAMTISNDQVVTLANALPVASGGTGITSFGTGVATALGQNVNGSGAISLTTSPTFVTPVLGVATANSINFGGSSLSTYAKNTSFTPTVTYATAGDLSVAYTTQTGYYSQIGNIVTYMFYVAFTPTFTTASGAIRINLPFAFFNASGLGGMGNIYASNPLWPAGTTQLQIFAQPNQAYVQILATGTAAGSYMSTTQFTSGVTWFLNGSITYITN